jgi:hypothetical protein
MRRNGTVTAHLFEELHRHPAFCRLGRFQHALGVGLIDLLGVIVSATVARAVS